MLLQVYNIEKTFVGKSILNGCSFHIEENEKCALVGVNGAGKSTMLKIITGEMTPDDGEVTLSSGATFGYLAQQEAVKSDNTIYDEVLSVKQALLDEEAEIRRLEQEMKNLSGAELESKMNRYSALTHDFELKNGYAIQSEVTGILKGLGFSEDEFTKRINTLSGGQKTRVALGKLLLSKPDIIMLDEPTNHLDVASIEWLEGFLKNYPGAVLIVAHDRYFLDKIVTKVFEIEAGSCRTFTGNYSAYAEKKKQLRDAAIKAYMNQQAEIKHQEAVITKLKQFNREKSIKRAESREKMLAKVDVLERPEDLNDAMNLSITPSIESGNDVLTVESLTKAFPDKPLFDNISFEIKKGERVALIGNNGTGKTTMLKILTGMTRADDGHFRLGTNVKIGYYDQEHQVLHAEKTLFQEISDAYPTLNNTKIRNTLASFLFTGDDVYKLIGELSGGERGRVSLAKLMLSNANFLLLDEPTNHLDITSKEILEQALVNYTGTVFYVSHDRYFINQTATRILDLTGHTVVNYIGNYDYYLAKKDELTLAAIGTSSDTGSLVSAVNAKSTAPTENKLSWEESKAQQAKIRKIKNDLKKCEDQIEKNEARSAEIDELLTHEDIARNVAECTKLSNEQSELMRENDELMEKWETLNSELDELNS